MKTLLDYIKRNVEDEKYVVSIETNYNNCLNIKELKMTDIIEFANYLNKLDISKCKKIGIFINNCNDFVKAFYSILLNNKIVVSICNSVDIKEFEDIVLKNNLKFIITNDKNIEKIIKVNKKINIINLSNLKLKENKKLDFVPSDKRLNDVLVVSYTSGTSDSFSKGVELTYKNITFVSEEYQKVYKLDSNSQIITVLPLWHNYAMFACLTSSIVAKSKLIIMDKWNAELFIEINKKLIPTVFPGSPYMYIDLINNHEKELIKLSNLKICDSGGDSLPIECILKFEKLTGAVITEGYGLTETASLTHFNYSASERKVGSLGKTVSNTKCKILDLNGKPLKNGEWGLLWIKGPMVFKDYVKIPGLKNKVKNNGWFNTNDVVRCDDDGYYYIAGRFSDLKNLNINDNQLRDLENKLYKFDGISRIHIKTNYNELANFYFFDIFAILKNNYKIENLYDYINSNLKDYIIGDVKVVSELPTTNTGKIKRRKVNELLDININNYKKTELFGGLRCKTYLLEKKDKYIYQEYFENTMYQAKKKYDILNLIQNNINSEFITKAYSYGKDSGKTWLLTEYKKGNSIEYYRKHDKFIINDISEDLARTLYKIHNISVNSKYGWITDNEVYENETFTAYLESELNRFKSSVKDSLSEKDFKYMVNLAKEKINIIKKEERNFHPQLIWFDLNPNNILVCKESNSYKLSSIIDAGGAKIGIKEWDLAFLKMETCINDSEYKSVLNAYKKIDKTINEDVIDALCVFIELDDMIIRVLDNVKLSIPYDSSFKDIIKSLK